MNDTVFIGMMLAFLAVAGVEPGNAHVSKVCKVGIVSQLFSNC